MEVTVIDDFLPQGEFEEIRDLMIYNHNFDWYFQKEVNGSGRDCTEEFWNWYGTHMFYTDDYAKSNYCIKLYNIFIPRFREMGIFHSLLRIKGNFYPHTETLREHDEHVDYTFSHIGALYSLNTCDGFTRLYDGTKISSIANRILILILLQLTTLVPQQTQQEGLI